MKVRCDGTKEPESAEDYLLLEIERLKRENEELKQEIDDRCFRWILCNNTPNAKYLMSFEDGAIKIEEVKENDKQC